MKPSEREGLHEVTKGCFVRREDFTSGRRDTIQKTVPKLGTPVSASSDLMFRQAWSWQRSTTAEQIRLLKDRIERLTEDIRLQEGRDREKKRLRAALECVEDPAVAEAISDRIEELSRSRSVQDLQDSLDRAKG